jgi:hypothetical protein
MASKISLNRDDVPITSNLSLVTQDNNSIDTSNTSKSFTISENLTQTSNKQSSKDDFKNFPSIIVYLTNFIWELLLIIKAKKLEIESLSAKNSPPMPNPNDNFLFGTSDENELLKLKINKLEDEIISLNDIHLKEVNDLKDKLAAAKKNSTNSSKKGSGEITAPPKKHKKDPDVKGKPGAPKGHKANFRTPIPPEDLDEIIKFDPDSTVCSCGCEMEPSPKNDIVQQQLELKENPVLNLEYRGKAFVCPGCGKTHTGIIPEDVKKAGLLGPRLTSLIASLRAMGNSYSSIQTFLEGIGVQISRGELCEILTKKVSAALKAAYEEVKESIPQQSVIGIDETGLGYTGPDESDGGTIKHKRLWTWCFNTSLIVFFYISASRSCDILIDVLGENFKGAIECDFFSAYKKYKKLFDTRMQFCHSHLIRDINFLVDHYDKKVSEYGLKLRALEIELFVLYHQRKTEEDKEIWNQINEKLRCCKQSLIEAALDAPEHHRAQNMAKRFRDYSQDYVNFVDFPELSPTNNRSEQAIRFVVINRTVSQGIRSKAGKAFSERLWTAKGTCARNNVPLRVYLEKAIRAYNSNMPHPSLLNMSNL